MNYYQIDTERLRLVACTKELIEASINNTERLSNLLQASVPAQWTHFGTAPFEFALQQLNRDDELNWWTYFPLHKAHNTMIGSCGYKGKPDKRGIVEIGYEVIEAYQNKGLATEIACALIKNAFSDPRVEIVQAHTLAKENASVAILKKCGMLYSKDVIDEEDGALWQWQLYKYNSQHSVV